MHKTTLRLQSPLKAYEAKRARSSQNLTHARDECQRGRMRRFGQDNFAQRILLVAQVRLSELGDPRL